MRTISRIMSMIVLPALLLISPGCEKFLQKDPQGSLTQESFPVTPSDALLATNSTYTTLREWFFHSGGYPILDIMSDDASKGSNPGDQASTVGPYNTFSILTTQDGLDRWWNEMYLGVKRANVVIEKVPEISMDEGLRNRYIAEARFIRGLLYFDMVRAWGGIPLVTTLNPPLRMSRASVDSVYALIIRDLLFAVDNLPEKSTYTVNEVGRASKGAARSMLARVYLFRHDFLNAQKYAMDVINSGEYSLEPVYVDANGVLGNNGVESVFEIGALPLDGTEQGGDQYGNTQGVRGTPNRGWGFNRPTLEFRGSFEPGDPRIKGTIIDLGDTIDGVIIYGDASTPDVTKNSNGQIIEVECYNRKVWTPGENVPTQWATHRRLMRYADVLLMASEALNENNNPSEALVYLNMVRARARQGDNSILPDITTTDQTALRQIIYTERRHELGMEGWRFWDLVRTGQAATVLGPFGFVQGKNEVLPIPQNEIDISGGTLVQNPFY